MHGRRFRSLKFESKLLNRPRAKRAVLGAKRPGRHKQKAEMWPWGDTKKKDLSEKSVGPRVLKSFISRDSKIKKFF